MHEDNFKITYCVIKAKYQGLTYNVLRIEVIFILNIVGILCSSTAES